MVPSSGIPGGQWSPWEMLRPYNAAAFYRVTGALYVIRTAIDSWNEEGERPNGIDVDGPLDAGMAGVLLNQIRELQSSLLVLGTKVTSRAVDRLLNTLADIGMGSSHTTCTYAEFARRYTEIDSRLKDELTDVTAFVLQSDKARFYDPPEPLFGTEFVTKFASGGTYEVDEAAKCMALGRDTAAVFHFMRCMEIGIRSVAKSLGIPDPIGADRNWAAMLKNIKAAMDARRNLSSWKTGDREIFESAYASLDAVRSAWRNTTMHVENKYTPEEAEHIFVAVRGFMKTLASRMDEQGEPLA
jgi:hypothetical protein